MKNELVWVQRSKTLKLIRDLNLTNKIRQHTRYRRENRSWCQRRVSWGGWQAWDGTWKFEILAGDTPRKERSLRRSCLRGVPLVGNLSRHKGWQSLASRCCKIPVKRCHCVKILGSKFAYSVVFAGKQGAAFLYFIQRHNIYKSPHALGKCRDTLMIFAVTQYFTAFQKTPQTSLNFIIHVYRRTSDF